MSDQTSGKAPRIRFKGYVEHWTDIPVDKLIRDRVERTVIQNQYPVLTSSQQHGIVRQTDYFADRQVTTDKNVGYLVLPRGCFSYRSRSDNDSFVFNRNDILDKGIISYYYPVFEVVGCDSDFFLRRINHGLQRQISVAAEGTGQRVLAHSRFKKITASYPCKDEQIRIGAYFQELDRLISLHQRKHKKLVEIKAAMLHRMFPEPGSNAPEVRFGGFSGPWSSEVMKTLGKFSKGAGFSKSDLKASGTPIVLYGRLYTDYQTAITQVDTFVDDRKGTVKSKGNEVVVPASGESAEDIARASAILTSGIIIGGDLNIISPCELLDPYFLALALSHGQPKHDLARRAQGKTVVHVRGTDIASVSISFPDLREQERIAAYFRSINELIVRHSNQIKKLQQVKLACQESMFA